MNTRDRVARALIAALGLMLALGGCAGGAPPGNYIPKDFRSNPQWVQASQTIVRLGKIANPSRPAEEWRLGFIKSEKVNATSVGGGTIYVTDGFTRLPQHQQEAVLAHEIGHDLAGHRSTKVGLSIGLNAAFTVVDAFIPGSGLIRHAVNPLAMKAFSRTQELEADRLAAMILIKAKGNLSGVENLRDFFLGASGSGGGGLFDTHPAHAERVAQLNEIIRTEARAKSSFQSSTSVRHEPEFKDDDPRLPHAAAFKNKELYDFYESWLQRPGEKAFALAYDPGTSPSDQKWAAGRFDSSSTIHRAMYEAMARCERQRKALQIIAPCELVGSR